MASAVVLSPPMHVTSRWGKAAQGFLRGPLTRHLLSYMARRFCLTSAHDSLLYGGNSFKDSTLWRSLESVQLAHRQQFLWSQIYL